MLKSGGYQLRSVRLRSIFAQEALSKQLGELVRETFVHSCSHKLHRKRCSCFSMLSGLLGCVLVLDVQRMKSAFLQLRGCPNLHQVVISPINACPALTTLDLSNCCGLKYVLIQSVSISQIILSNNVELTKVCSARLRCLMSGNFGLYITL
jgi:hypothetical protein